MKKYIKPEDRNIPWVEVPRAIWYFLGKNKSKFIWLNGLLLLVLFYDLLPPYIMGKVVDFFTAYRQGDSLTIFYFYAIGLGVASIIVSFIRLTSKNHIGKIAINSKSTARTEGFERLMDFSLEWHSSENTGNKVQRIFTGSQAIHEWSFMCTNNIFPALTSFVGVLGAFAFLSPVFMIFLLIYASSYFAIEYHFGKKAEKLAMELNKFREKSSGTYIESTGNILAIKALGAEKNLHSRVKTAEKSARDVEIEMANNGTVKWYAFQTLNGLALTTFFMLIAHQFIAGYISVGSILVFFAYFTSLRNATYQLTDISTRVIQLKADLVRMMPIFKQTSKIKTGDHVWPDKWEKITISNGQFSYPSGQVGLKDLEFTLHKNEKLGVAGHSGGGKSSLIKVLLGLYEIQGEFKVGSENYYDISHDETVKNTSVVLQETELFNLSLMDNITVSRDVPSDLLEKAIDTAQLSDLLARLPDGLSTLIGERGYALSGGERQRVGIARAICKDAPILILDEATSALDTQTEKKIMEKLLVNFKNKTILIVAHRLSTLNNTDRIIVFDQGTIIEEGTFDELRNRPNSRFGLLNTTQP